MKSPVLDKLELKRQIHTLHLAIIAAFLSYATYEIFYIFYSPKIFGPAIFITSIYLIFNILTYFLFVNRRYKEAKIVLICIMDASLLVLCFFVFGPKASLHYYFLVFAILPLILWRVHKLIPIATYFIINIGIFLLIDQNITYYNLLVDFPDELIIWFKITTIVINFGLIIYTAWYYTNSNEKITTELQHVNKQLEEKHKQVRKQQIELEKINQELEINNYVLNLKNTELQEANSTKNKMFSIIAHDLKSPLNSLVGLANLLNERVDNFDMQKIRKYVSVISQSSNNLKNLVINLLNWARTQLQSLEVNKKNFQLNDLIDENICLAQQDISKKEINIITEFNSDNNVFADIDMTNTIIRNLLTNAIKYTPNGGEIKFICTHQEKNLNLEIKDTGVGMSKKKIDDLFRIDKVKSTPGTNNERGTGIGLLLCHELAQLNDYSMSVISELGKGTSFNITIPAV